MNISTDYFFDSSVLHIYTEIVSDYLPDFLKGFEYTPWVWSLVGSAVIGLSGILPLLIIPGPTNNNVASSKDRGDQKDLTPEFEDRKYIFVCVVSTFTIHIRSFVHYSRLYI